MTVEIKVCGLTRLIDVLKALDLGADYVGFVLYSKSPRYIELAALNSICRQLPDHAKTVGVFVNPSRDEVLKFIEECGPYAVQLHGDENLEDFIPLPAKMWKAVRITPGHNLLPADAVLADRIILDTSVPGLYGGSGIPVDLDAARTIAVNGNIMLAGGLTPENVREAVAFVKPVGVDVSSGVEDKPGIKNHTRMSAFISAARA